ncbi:trk system potassium uptake protein TrkA [Desulfomicrobium macestii]|uniref:Trk system potassium uptake protein TrkA n=1 Tax=Desulfomicrobium macestii TaxID=90731 RepID=A0ABR9H6G2_9BACT|nr:TrkA family potassium uptake protein [Desulfomicrobium macestii]MBE1426286.1 trk system potassium uptake protein TrkA [Desulfomicrobium macestii]
MARREFGVVGLGKFGLSLAKSLMAHGQTVVGVDSDPEKVKAASEVLTQAYQAEAVDKVALEQLGLGELPSVIVSTGHSMEASILITLFLKELGCKSVTVKAMSRDHEKVLIKVGADAVIFPERYAAEQLAAKLAVPGLIDYLPLGTNVILKEIIVEDWAGKTLRELDLTNTIGIQVVAVKRLEEKQFVFVPKADEPLQKGDVLAVIGHGEELLDLDS